ncbi:MAG: bifunctional riboflavin kinase/FAD synthetase [Candidatus Omnitrophota bacterium]
MEVIYGIHKIKKYPKPVVALGVFDGVHLGHRKILKSAVRNARREHGTSIVFTFWPHPQKEGSLYSLEHRLKLISELGIDVCVIIRFNKKLARVSANDFIRNVLFKKLGASYIFVGRNFKFGKKAQGDGNTLQKASVEYHFKVRVFPVVRINGAPVSSTYIRTQIKKGNLKAAQRLLNRPVSILGTVVRGISLGRKFGIPTANIDPHHEVIPPKGVYAVKVNFRNKKFEGACYIGPKPAFLKHQTTTSIEVHILNFNRNIYGRTLEVQFIRKIRSPRKFSSPAALAAQIKKDILESSKTS